MRPPPQTPVNVPAIDEAVCVVIWYLKLPHELGLGSVGNGLDAHVPTNDGVDVLVLVPVPPAPPVVEVGARTLLECWKPQLVATLEARASTASRHLFILQTCSGAHSSVGSRKVNVRFACEKTLS